MLPADLGLRMVAHDGCEEIALPEWAASFMWLGAWCRTNQIEGKRLIVFSVLPTRDFAAAFAGLGSLVAGAGLFEDSLTWQVFRRLPIGSNIFWMHKNSGAKYSGNIIGFDDDHGSEFINIEVKKAAKKSNIGTTWKVNKRYFDEYRFTENKPPSANKSKIFDAAEHALGALVGNLNPKWIWSDGAECLLVASVNAFESSIENLSLSIDGGQAIAMSSLLCMARNKDQNHAKIRIDHPRGIIDGSFPLVILDGSRAFMMNEHFNEVPNMLIILDRQEYQDEIHDIAKTLRSFSQDGNVVLQGEMPEVFMPSIEIAAYLIDKPL